MQPAIRQLLQFVHFPHTACPSGYYRALGITDACTTCPQNTKTDAPGAPSCECNSGFFRAPGEGANFGCTGT